MPITFYLNTTVSAEADTSLAGITSAEDGLSFHDQCSRTFDLNKHMMSEMQVAGQAEEGENVYTYRSLSATAALLAADAKGDVAMQLYIEPTLEELQNRDTQNGNTLWSSLDEGALGTADNGDIITIRIVADETENATNDGLYEAKVTQEMGTADSGMGLTAFATLNTAGELSVTVTNPGIGYDVNASSFTENGVDFEVTGVDGTGMVTAMTAGFTGNGNVPTDASGTTYALTTAQTAAFNAANADPCILQMHAVKGGTENHVTGRVDNAFFSEFAALVADTNGDTKYLIESAERSEILEENLDRVQVDDSSKLLMGFQSWKTAGNQLTDEYIAAQVAYGFRNDQGNLIATDDATQTQRWTKGADEAAQIAMGKHSLIDAFTDGSDTTKLGLLEKDDKMWESLLTQLALSGINKYTPNVDYSATNLIDFGTPLTRMRGNNVQSVDDNTSRGLSNYYNGYLSNAAANTNGASTWSEMVRTAEDLSINKTNPTDRDTAINTALTSLGKQLGAAGRTNSDGTIAMKAGDMVNITLQVEVTDADDSVSALAGLTSIAPKFLALSYVNDTEESKDCDKAEYNEWTSGKKADGSNSAMLDADVRFSKPLIRLTDSTPAGLMVVTPKRAANKPALRIRLRCTHQDST